MAKRIVFSKKAEIDLERIIEFNNSETNLISIQKSYTKDLSKD